MTLTTKEREPLDILELNVVAKAIRNAICRTSPYPLNVWRTGEAEANIQEWCKWAAFDVLEAIEERKSKMPTGMEHREAKFSVDILKELEKARSKFPVQDVWVTLAALTEEIGELNQAILQRAHQPEKGVTLDHIYKEGVQVAVMVMRVLFDSGLK